ncbi:hypothetical protein EIN_086890 [Entamoeba invadens IP1]|uniref:Uncharacterized protein n=1 Tax=Entamoeba invadens TaxID=33085 RepID=S0AZ25_ENTIV|nr:hypothetical protein EIN_086890 [Entamoeba invadens IP1]ELP85407.1 hypothetical protein EIN_086890 [Entamoeba invadens IP1]BAN40553.1 hypothetical protein [Entamoeba invadens]|eukprot:XP_004184753.1 hypothetical protein EIN_086890 [Entamoeba invadens IP1]
MSAITSTKTVFTCVCGNISVITKKICEESDLKYQEQSEWKMPICSQQALVTVKYPELQKDTSLTQNVSMLSCTLCGTEVCQHTHFKMFKEASVKVNPLLRNVDSLRKNMIYSETFGVWIEISDTENSDYKMNAVDKEILRKEKETIEELFEEKERKVREFVMQQEDLFEEQRREIKNQFLMLKKQCAVKSEVHSASCPSSPLPQNNIPGQCHHCSSSHQWSGRNDVFLFDEEEEENCEGMSYVEQEKADNRVFKHLNFVANSVPTKNDQVEDEYYFPATFKDFAFEKTKNESAERFSFAANTLKRTLI